MILTIAAQAQNIDTSPKSKLNTTSDIRCEKLLGKKHHKVHNYWLVGIQSLGPY